MYSIYVGRGQAISAIAGQSVLSACLTEKGVIRVRSIVRAEHKANLEIFLMWVPGVVGLIGAAIGLASILIRK